MLMASESLSGASAVVESVSTSGEVLSRGRYI